MTTYDDILLEKLLAENPAVRPTDYSTGLTNTTSQPSLDELMASSYTPQPLVRPMPAPQPQRLDLETMRQVYPKAFPTAQGAISEGIPESVRNRARMSGFLAQLSNFGNTLGKAGREGRLPVNPAAPMEARRSVINDYINRKNAQEANRRADMALALQKKRVDFATTPKPVDPIKQASEYYKMQKEKADAMLKINEAKQIDNEEERKKSYIKTINDIAAKNKIDPPLIDETWPIEQLEKLAIDFAEHPLKYKRSKALGGIRESAGGTGISAKTHPEAAKAAIKGMVADAVFLDNPDERVAYEQLRQQETLSPSEERYLKRVESKLDANRNRMKDSADRWLLKFSDPKHDVFKLFEEIKNLKAVLAKYPNVPGWNEVTSSIENLGDLGKWIVDVTSVKDPRKKEILMALRRYKEAYSRAASGAAIANHEWVNFSRQLGVGAFSNAQTLKTGVDTAERAIRNAIQSTYNLAVDERIQPEYYDRVKELLPYSSQSNDESFEAL